MASSITDRLRYPLFSSPDGNASRMDHSLLRRLTSLHTKCFEHGIGRIGIKTRLKLGKEFSRNCGNIAYAGHREENTAGPATDSHLKLLGEILDGDNVAA